VDAEGCFRISILKVPDTRTGYRVRLFFSLSLHSKDLALLEKIQESLGGVGKIYKHGPFSIQLRVYLMEELKILINYFDKYPLITQKYADYQLFKQAFLLIDNKEHLTEEGLQKLVAIRASMNLGNSVALKAAFLPSSPAPPGRRGGRYNPSYKTFSGKSVNSSCSAPN